MEMLVKVQGHAKSKLHTDAILVITSIRIGKALSGPIGIQEKYISTKYMFQNWLRLFTFWEKHYLPMKKLYQPLLHFVAFDLEEPIAKQYLENCPKNTTYYSHATTHSLISDLNKFIKKNE